MVAPKNNISQGGFAHLAEQSNPKRTTQPQPIDAPEWPKDKVLKLRCILEGVDYYIPNGECMIDTAALPYCPFAFNLGYSVVRDGMKIISILKHHDKRFFQTGISTEVVNLPEWWADRDK